MAAIICITVMLTSQTVTMQAVVDASGGQGDNNGTVCTQIVEAAQNELNDADKTVGGYRYKNWYGMDANWCACFVSWFVSILIEKMHYCQHARLPYLLVNIFKTEAYKPAVHVKVCFMCKHVVYTCGVILK